MVEFSLTQSNSWNDRLNLGNLYEKIPLLNTQLFVYSFIILDSYDSNDHTILLLYIDGEVN